MLLLSLLLPGESETARVARFTGLMAGSVLLWASEVIPLGLAGIVSLVALQAAGFLQPNELFQGYGSSSTFFLIGVMYMGELIARTGTAERSLLWVARRLRMSLMSFAAASPIVLFGTAALVSSATARATILKPAYDSFLGNPEDSEPTPPAADPRLQRYVMLIIGNLSTLCSRAFLSGGPGVIVLAQLMAEAGVRLTWWTWAVWMVPPVFLIVMLAGLLHWLVLRPSIPRQAARWDGVELTSQDRTVLLILALLVLAWVIGDHIDLSSTVSVWLAVLAANRLVRGAPALASLDWDTVFLSGAILAVAPAFVRSGAAAAVAEPLGRLMTPSMPVWVAVTVLLLGLGLLRIPVVGGVAFAGVGFPVAQSLSGRAPFTPVELGLLTSLAAGIVFLPTQSNPGLIASKGGGYSYGESLVSGLLSFAATVVVVSWMAVPYWRWLAGR